MLTLNDPFKISARLLPALEIGEGTWLSFEGVKTGRDSQRMAAKMILDFPDGLTYEDDSMQSGCGGFQGMVTVFETYLGFLAAALESYPDGENADLFPSWVLERLDKNDIEYLCATLSDEEGRGIVNEHLIEGQ